MKKNWSKIIGLLLVLALVVSVSPSNLSFAAKKASITVLETSDIHGLLMNHDYATDTPVNKGYVQAATVINEQREIDPNLIYVDCGDSVQGNLVSEFRTAKVHPVIKALNYMQCDAWELGNHEFNFEFKNLKKNIKNFNGHVLGGNIYKKNGERFVEPYFIKEVNGVKVAIFGIEAPHITRWESDSSHYNNMTFTTPMEEVGKILDEIEKEKVDVVIGLCHYGEDGEYELEENGGMRDVAEAYADRVDAFLIGHAHSELTEYLVDGQWQSEYSKDASTVILETGTGCVNVGKLTIDLKKSGKKWTVVDKKVENLSTADKEPDAGLVKILKKVHKQSVAMANEVVGSVAENFHDDPYYLPGIPSEIISDGPVLDLIHKVQLEKTGADVSCAALFNADSNLVAGDFKYKDSVNVYKYDNTLFAVKVTGKQLKAIMEQQAGNFFNQYQDGDLTISFNPDIRMYNYDTFQGVNYEIDISKPAGQRIKNVTYKGKKLKDNQKLVLALNNYRFGGLCSAGLLNKEDAIYDSAAVEAFPAVRDMVTNYVIDNKVISPECDNNWKIVGYNFDYEGVDTEAIYEKIRSGEIAIPTSADGRTPNVKSVNLKDIQ